MKPSLKTRKPIVQLSLLDIRTFAIWEFATDEEGVEEQDETWVRPLRGKHVPRDMYSLIVAASLRAANGGMFEGIVDVTTSDQIQIGGAAVITDSAYVSIPTPGYWRAAAQRRAAADALGIAENDLFPLEYTLAVLIEGEPTFRKGQF